MGSAQLGEESILNVKYILLSVKFYTAQRCGAGLISGLPVC